jgi:predicted transcriptional regulator YdeE
MQPTLARLEPFFVVGISARTINREEADPEKARLGNLWNRFFSDSIMQRVPNQAAESNIYGVYSEYESDATGHYTTTVGIKTVEPPESDGEFTAVKVQGGEYLVFEKQGPIPDIVVETWQSIWEYFSTTSDYDRMYTTDFEEFRGQDHVAIHIAVRRQT